MYDVMPQSASSQTGRSATHQLYGEFGAVALTLEQAAERVTDSVNGRSEKAAIAPPPS
jgi:hypothetical protein